MIETIKAGYDSAKAALGIAQGIAALKTETAVNQAVIDIQRNVMETQRALMEADGIHSADLARIDELKQEIVHLKDWTAEKERYHLVDVDRGAMAYMPKPGMEQGEPAHWLCANCFNQKRKSFLQHKGTGVTGRGGRTDEAVYGCDNCKGSMTVFWRRKPAYPGDPAE